MKLTLGEVGDLVSALDDAIDVKEMIVRSDLPPRRVMYDEADEENEAAWKQALKCYRRLRRKLAKVVPTRVGVNRANAKKAGATSAMVSGGKA